MPPSTPHATVAEDCCCHDADIAEVNAHPLGCVVHLVCFRHNCITPQGRALLKAVITGQVKVYPAGVIGVARVGKSYLLNCLAKFVLKFYDTAGGNAKAPFSFARRLGEFSVSNQPKAHTKGVDIMVLPRFFDAKFGQLANPDGIVLIFDAEGQDMGSTTCHEAILGILSRIVTSLSYVEGGQLNYGAVRSLGRLISSNMVLPNPNGAQLPWPYLSILANKYSLAPPHPNHATWITNLLQPSAEDPANNADRTAVKTTFLDKRRLDYHTIPVDPFLDPNIGPGLQNLPEETQRAIRQPALSATEDWCRAVLGHCTPFSFQFAAGASNPAIAHVTGADFAEFIHNLVKSYGESEKIRPIGAMESMVLRKCDLASSDALAHYDANRAQSQLNRDYHEVNGAKGTEDDGQAKAVLAGVKGRHDALTRSCLKIFDDNLTPFMGLGLDDQIKPKRDRLNADFTLKFTDTENYWNHQRGTRSAASESGTEDGPAFNRVHHTENERVYFHTVTHYYWASYVHRWTKTRTVSTRHNGDIVYGPWIRENLIGEVLVNGPWLGGAP